MLFGFNNCRYDSGSFKCNKLYFSLGTDMPKLLKMQEAFSLALFSRNTIIMRPYGTVCLLIPTYSSTACFALVPWRCTNENKLNTNSNTEVILMLGVFMRKMQFKL